MATTEDRPAALEREVTSLRERVDMESGLAASRDRDISELKVVQKSHTSMLQALQEGQADLRTDVEQIRSDVGEIKAGQQTIIGLLNRLIEGDEG